jgi:RNA polymerase sigma-B factor
MCAVALAPPKLSRTTNPERRDRAATRELERALLIRYHRTGDVAARDELVERCLPLARELARRYTYTDEPFDDLLQVASVGLIKAIDRFDPDRGAKFSSYAAPTILGELKRHFRDKGWALHVPRDLQDRTLVVSREADALSKRLGRSPKPREVARAIGCSVEEVLEAQQAAASYEAAVEASVLELRFMHDLNQREIGERIGYSQMHVSRLLRRALSRLETATAAA